MVVLLSSFTVSPSYGLDNSDPYFSECYRIGDLAKKVEYGQFTVNFAVFVASKSQKTKKTKIRTSEIQNRRKEITRVI